MTSVREIKQTAEMAVDIASEMKLVKFFKRNGFVDVARAVAAEELVRDLSLGGRGVTAIVSLKTKRILVETDDGRLHLDVQRNARINRQVFWRLVSIPAFFAVLALVRCLGS